MFAALTITLAIFLNQCDGKQKAVSGDKYKKISPGELKIMMGNKDFSLINVHIPYAGEIPGTDLFIAYNEIGEKLDLAKDSKIVLYCRSGSMSKTAAQSLVELGYTNIFDLEEGMIRWKREGNEIISIPGR